MTQEELYRDSYYYLVAQLRAVMAELDEKLEHADLSYREAFCFLYDYIHIFQGVHQAVEENFKTYSTLPTKCVEKTRLEAELCALLAQMRQYITEQKTVSF